MMKYTTAMVTFEEIPTEVTLSISISNCQGTCIGCHSPELREDIGTELTDDRLDFLIETNRGISCVLFLGEGKYIGSLKNAACRARNHGLKTALYSGREEIEEDLMRCFDYVKLGEYRRDRGPLNKRTTNQRLLRHTESGWEDITNLFWQ